MCSPSVRADTSGQQAREQEQERQSNVSAGNASIDNAFGGFNDDFYKKIGSDYTSAMTPQVTKSYDDAYRQLTLQMASTGNLESSSAARKFGALYGRQKDTLADIQNQALDREAQIRSTVDSTKRDLYGENSVAADPSQAAAAAQSAASSVNVPTTTPTLGDVFGDIVQGTAITAALNNLQQGNMGSASSPLLFGGGGYGNATGRIIR